MKILVLGGSAGNIGGYISKDLGNECIAISRRSNPEVNVESPESVQAIMEHFRPETIIFTAGVYPKLEVLGSISDWLSINSSFAIKTLGVVTVLNSAVKYSAKQVIVLGGTLTSSDPRFCHFKMANGAMWSAVQFASQHTTLEVYYLELGVVIPSTVGNAYINSVKEDQRDKVRSLAVSPDDVVNAIRGILSGRYKSGSRITVNKGDI